MNPFNVACLVVAVFSLANALFLFTRTFTLLRFIWGVLSTIVAFTNVNLFWEISSSSHAMAYRHAMALNLATIFIPILFFHFTCVLTNRRERKSLELKLYYAVTFIYAAAAYALPGDFVRDVVPMFELKYYSLAGPLYYFLPLWFFYLTSYGLILVCQAYAQATAIKKNQLKYFIIGCSLGIAGALSCFLTALGFPVRPWGMCLLPLYVWIVSYAIAKHQLMDIKIVLHKSLVYTCLISLLTVLLMVFVYLSDMVLRRIFSYTSTMESILGIALICLVAVPLYRLLQSFIDRMFYKGTVSQIAQENTRLHEEMLVLENNRVLREIANNLVLEIAEPLQRIKEHSRGTMAEGETNFVQNIIDQLREYSVTVPKDYAPVDIIPLLDQEIDKISLNFSGLQAGKKIFKYYGSFKSIMVPGSGPQLARCLNCLLTYCLKAVEKEGEIFVALEQNKQWVSLSIRHSGHGLTDHERENIFKPFFRAGRINNGLSLTLAHAIIIQHGGKIGVDTQQDSAVVDFLIDLPLV